MMKKEVITFQQLFLKNRAESLNLHGKLGFADARFGFNLCHYESPKYDAIGAFIKIDTTLSVVES